jgi:acetyl esterase/lipase
VLLFALSLVSATAQLRAESPPPSHENVAYGPHERNVLDIWLAKSDKPTPLVIFMHGGGFRRGDKEGVRGRPVIQQCLDAGVSFASINYRFLGHAGLPDILRDAGRSIQFLRANAEKWNLDPKRIAIYGSSAGAGTSMWLAFHDDLADSASDDPVLRQSSRVMAAGSLDGQVSYDLREWNKYLGPAPYERTPQERLEFYGFKSLTEAETPAGDRIMRDCAMIHLISSDDPPVAIACARPDSPPADRGHYLHHPKHSMALADECKQNGVECLLVLDKDMADREKQAEAVVGFLIEKLKAE